MMGTRSATELPQRVCQLKNIRKAIAERAKIGIENRSPGDLANGATVP